jgi:hypothetical protein
MIFCPKDICPFQKLFQMSCRNTNVVKMGRITKFVCACCRQSFKISIMSDYTRVLPWKDAEFVCDTCSDKRLDFLVSEYKKNTEQKKSTD